MPQVLKLAFQDRMMCSITALKIKGLSTPPCLTPPEISKEEVSKKAKKIADFPAFLASQIALVALFLSRAAQLFPPASLG